MWRRCVQTVVSSSFAVKWFICVHATRSADGAVPLGCYRQRGPCKSWPWGKGTFRKEFQFITYQVRGTKDRVWHGSVQKMSKTQIRKNGLRWPVAMSVGLLLREEGRAGLCTKETAPGGIPYLREFIMAPRSAPREQLHLPAVVPRNPELTGQMKKRNSLWVTSGRRSNGHVEWNTCVGMTSYFFFLLENPLGKSKHQ